MGVIGLAFFLLRSPSGLWRLLESAIKKNFNVALEHKPFEIGIWRQIKNGKQIVSVCKKKKLQSHEIPNRVILGEF
jgi:hypothetical protein